MCIYISYVKAISQNSNVGLIINFNAKENNNNLGIRFSYKYINREIETASLALSWKTVLRCSADDRGSICTATLDGAASDAADKMDQP